MSSVLQRARRIVVKVGSSLVTNEGRGVDADAVGHWCRQMGALAGEGRELVMVSSGAIAEGMKRLGWSVRPKEIPRAAGCSGRRPDGPRAYLRNEAARARHG
jgi:glutamate 5-kinase